MSLYKTIPIIVVPAFTTGCKMRDHLLRDFCGKPLIQRTFDMAVKTGYAIGINIRSIYLVTDDQDIANKYSDYITTLVIDRSEVSTENAVLLAMEAADNSHIEYECVMVLDPNYPLRNPGKLADMVQQYSDEYDMLVSVCRSEHNPYTDMFQKSRSGKLVRSKKLPSNAVRIPEVFVANPIATIYNPNSLRIKTINQMQEILPLYTKEYVDFNLDTPLGWEIAELVVRRTDPALDADGKTTYHWPL